MSSLKKKNGYIRVPGIDPDYPPVATEHTRLKNCKPPDLKPGLFVQFGKDRMSRPQVSESEDIEMKDLKPRKKHRKPKSPKSPTNHRFRQEMINEPIIEGDTIQRISLRYSCPVAELRRLNKLYSDVDLHALKTIKIPVKEHSLLSEPLERERRRNLVGGDPTTTGGPHSSSGNSNDEVHFGGPNTYYTSEDNMSADADDEYGNDSDTPEYRDISIQSALKWKHSRDTLFNKLDKDLEKAKTTVDNQKSNMREVRLMIDPPSVNPKAVQEYTKQMFELPDWRILAGVSLVAFILMLVGVVWYYKHNESS